MRSEPISLCLASIDLEKHDLLSSWSVTFFSPLCANPWMVGDPIDTLISPITTRTGPTVALPSTHTFCSGLGRTPLLSASRLARPAHQGLSLKPVPFRAECAFTLQQARRVSDMTRDWLQTSLSPQKMC